MSRLARSHLVERAPAEGLVEVVRDVCGIQAQAVGSAELQLAARVDGITQADVRRGAVGTARSGEVVDDAGTLHLHPADELSLWTAARRALEPDPDLELAAARGRTPLRHRVRPGRAA